MSHSQTAIPELELVDLTHGQVDPDVGNAAFFAAHNISGKDMAAYALADDVVSDYKLSADSLPQPGVPDGKYYHFRWTSHTVYPGVARSVYLYVPHGAEESESVNLLVFQDGLDYVGPQVRATTVLDNLVHNGEIPMTAGLFVCPGESGPGYPSFGGDDNRSIEYDTVSGDYARFLVNELFPVVRTKIRLTDDPKGRVICGLSSGGACAVTAAFHHPEEFGNVISHCGSFINVRGAHQLPTMFRQTPRKPIRIWHQTGSRDVDVIFGNIPIANHDLYASLKYRRYDSHFEFGNGGHSLRHGGAVLPETLRWIFRDQVEDR
jgi:enterochelin esterase family protein